MEQSTADSEAQYVVKSDARQCCVLSQDSGGFQMVSLLKLAEITEVSM